MAEKLGTVTVNGIWVVESDTNPTLGGGLSAPQGSIISANDGSGLFYKTGSLDTDYTKVPVTTSDVTSTLLTGFAVGANTTLLATDTILSAFGKTQGQLNNKQNSLGYTPVNVAGDTMLGYLILNADPISALGATTKNYVDNLINGIDWKASAYAGTVVALPAYTVSGGGQVLTGNVNGAIPSATLDNAVGIVVGSRLLIKNEVAGNLPNNGIYVVTQVGDGTHPFILTRSSDANTGALLSEATLSVLNGTTLSNTQWHCNPASLPVIIGTTGITFVQIGSGVYTNGAGLSLTGNVFSVSNLGITNAMIANTTIDLTAKVTGVLPVTNGGTGTATAFTAGSIVFAGVGGVYSQDNAMFFWDDTNNIFYVGVNSGAFTNTKAHFQATVNSYSQINSINKSAGTSASADYITTNDAGTDTINYTDLGINSSTYSDPAYTIGGANAGYLYCNGGDLTIGTQTATKNIIFHTGGTLIANKRMEINDSGYRLMPLAVPVAPLSGQVWNDSTQLSFGITQTIGNIFYVGFLSGNTGNSNTVVSTIAETNFTSNGSTFVIPANSLAVNKRIRVTAWGIYSAVLGNTLTIRLKTGATTLLTTGARAQQTVTVANVGFKIDAIILVRTLGAGGTVVCNMNTLFSETPFEDGTIVPSNGTKAFNTTASNTIQFSAQWGTSSASNSITIEDILFEVLN